VFHYVSWRYSYGDVNQRLLQPLSLHGVHVSKAVPIRRAS
jgi:hypothetical protein